MNWRATASILALGAWVGLSAAAPQGAPVTGARLLGAASEPGNWLTHGGTYLEQRFSTLTQVNDGNVAKLGLAWSYDLDTNRGQEATPLIIDGVMYTTTAWSKVVALDAATGRELWTFDPKVPGERGFSACCDVVNRGLAAYGGRLYFGTLDGRLIALDARTGKVLIDAFDRHDKELPAYQAKCRELIARIAPTNPDNIALHERLLTAPIIAL